MCLPLYIDDMLIASKHKLQIDKLEQLLNDEFEIKDFGCAKKDSWDRDHKEQSYWCSVFKLEEVCQKVLESFDIQNSKPILTLLGTQFKLFVSSTSETVNEKFKIEEIPYAQTVGSLMYAIVCMRPNIAYALSIVSRFLSCRSKIHQSAIKWILRYLWGTSDYGLL